MLRVTGRRGVRTAVSAVVAVVLGCAALTACTSSTIIRPLPVPPPSAAPASPSRPNIVFVLTDDLSWNLVKYMPHVQALQQQGMTFTNYTVADSLCCPSRASIFTGRFPHNTHILGNGLPTGGFEKFRALHEERSTFATALLKAGYRTAFMGKYLNGYEPNRSNPPKPQWQFGAYVPPGWSQWNAVGSGGYAGFNYVMADGHTVDRYGDQPQDYMNTVLTQKSTAFVRAAASGHNPFMLEVATFTPHKPYTPAPADIGTFAGIKAPRTPAYDRLPSPAPQWMRKRHPLDAAAQAKIRTWWEQRVEGVQSVDRMIGDLEQTLQATGQAGKTDFVFSSDNGYHLGEYTFEYGKQTAFDTDIRVPLVVAGPGIPAGTTSPDLAENIDLRPTFDQLAGASTPADVDGRSLVPVLHGQPTRWRSYALVEHTKDTPSPSDPDAQNRVSGIPPSYTAIRSRTFLYVRYASGDREYYDLTKDPFELHNLGPRLPPRRVATLDRIMNALESCSGSACWDAGVPATQ